MRIRFLGAAGDVTGSAYHVVTKDANLLVDCGFFQGRREERGKNRRKEQIEGGKLDAVVLTHGHPDHIGRLPLLTRNGYTGPIYATKPTIELATLILKDSLGLQKLDLKRENRMRARSELPPLEPLFGETDVRKLKDLVKPVKYNQAFQVAPGVEARLVDAGHVIGSASVELTVSENGHKKVVVFSGDLGRAKKVTIFGEEVPVRASIHTMGGFSAHADQSNLIDWYSAVAPSKPRTIITHGEDRAREVFSSLIQSRFGMKTERPALGEVIEI